MQSIANTFLFGIVISLVLGAGCTAKDNDTPSKTSGTTSKQATTPQDTIKADNLTVYYFHTTYRCWTCNQFEKVTKEILKDDFGEKLADSTITFRVINIEQESNKHFVDDYKLVTKSLVLSLRKDGRELAWNNLDKIWQLVRDTDRFREYVKSAIEAYSKRIR